MYCKASDCFSCPYPDCINDSVPELRKMTPEQLARDSKRRKAIRTSRAAAGVCTRCGKRQPKTGYKMCPVCQAKNTQQAREFREKHGTTPRILMDGVLLCATCGKTAPKAPYKLCERCLKSSRANIGKAPTHKGKKPNGGFSDENKAFWAWAKAKIPCELKN